ncbi:MAG: hypothetical protein ACLQQB_05635 [Solirubrobacteraceae bacterium]
MRRIAVGPAVLVLLSLTGCGAAATKTTTAPTAASPVAAQRAVVGVLTKYETAYSAHNASGLGSTLATNVVRTGDGADGCEHASGETAVLAAYEAQWTAGAGRYQFIGLSPQAVKVTGHAASVKLSYRIAPTSEGIVEFRLGTNGKEGRWFITNITANCNAAPTTTAATPISSEHLSDSEYKELEGKTALELISFLGDKAPVGYEGEEAFLRSEKEAFSEATCVELFKATVPCFGQLGESLAHTAKEAREQASAMAAHMQGPCGKALQTDATIWAHLERVGANFEQGRYANTVEEWVRAAAPAEKLVITFKQPGNAPQVELGSGLQNCRPLNLPHEVTAAEHIRAAARSEAQKIEQEHREEASSEAKEDHERLALMSPSERTEEEKREKEHVLEGKESEERQNKAIQETREPKRTEEHEQKEEREHPGALY